MKKTMVIALLSFACLVRVAGESPDAGWRETFEKAFSSALASRTTQVNPAIAARYRLLADNRIPASRDPSVAGEAAAQLLFRYERDIRSGVDLQEAGARLMQAVTLMGGSDDPGKVLRTLGMVRKSGRTDNAAGTGFDGRPASDAGRETHVREKGK